MQTTSWNCHSELIFAERFLEQNMYNIHSRGVYDFGKTNMFRSSFTCNFRIYLYENVATKSFLLGDKNWQEMTEKPFQSIDNVHKKRWPLCTYGTDRSIIWLCRFLFVWILNSVQTTQLQQQQKYDKNSHFYSFYANQQLWYFNFTGFITLFLSVWNFLLGLTFILHSLSTIHKKILVFFSSVGSKTTGKKIAKIWQFADVPNSWIFETEKVYSCLRLKSLSLFHTLFSMQCFILSLQTLCILFDWLCA